MSRITHTELQSALKDAQGAAAYARMKAECESAVVEWRWANCIMEPYNPHDRIVMGWRAQKWLKQPDKDGFIHGLDEQQRIRVVRSKPPTSKDSKTDETFVVEAPGGAWWFSYTGDCKTAPIEISWIETDGDRWLRKLAIDYNCVREHLLHWEAGQLVRQEDRNWSGVNTQDVPKALQAQFSKQGNTTTDYEYSEDGNLQSAIEKIFSGTDPEPAFTTTKYLRLPEGVTLKTLLADAEEILVREIPPAIQKLKLSQPVYAMLLKFTGVDTDVTGYPPPLLLPTAALREKIFQDKTPAEALYFCWSIADLVGFDGVSSTACEHTELDEKLQTIFQLTINKSSSSYAQVRKMYQRVCARLNALDWSQIMPTTDDFIIFPADDHGEMDPKKDLLASVPHDKLTLLMERKRIWKMKLK